MNVPSRVFGQQYVTSHHDFFGGSRDPLQAEPGGDDAFMHGSAGRERRVFAVIGNGYAEGARVLQRSAHQMAGNHRLAVIAHRDGAGADELSKLGELLSPLSQGDGSYRVDSRLVRSMSLTDDEAYGGLIVGDGIGVGHRADGAEAPSRRSHRSAGDGLQLLLTGLSEMYVEIDETWCYDLSGCLEDQRLFGRSDVSPYSRNCAPFEVDICDSVDVASGVYYPASPNQNRPHRSSAPL